ncbi:negative acting factor [Stagonosporopsis vannaccii]|nr:negative acting factor [Stagonosporopsis vannaccii]
MRQLGKCDGCRQRKVKCDEQKPFCGGCRKGNRPCNYSYSGGRGFALVIQDPSQMTRYGRSMTNSIIYPLSPSQSSNGCSTPDSSSLSSPDATTLDTSDLHLRGGMVASDGRGIFQTLAPIKMRHRKVSKKVEAAQKRRCQEHLLRLQQEISLASHRPFCSETTIAAGFVSILRPEAAQHQQIYTLGNWVSSIPSRIGHSPVVTMAAEFFINSFDVYRNRCHSTLTLALRTKAKALKELQLSVLASQKHPTYDAIIATKLHYAAEVLLGVENLHYAIHTLGLMDLLKLGTPSDADEHFWDILDNTYIDDITIAMTAGRPSIYDNDAYLTMTHPEALSNFSLSKKQNVTRVMMHILIQCPRLIVAIRRAIREPKNVVAVASAFSLMEELWKLSQLSFFAEFIDASVKIAEKSIEESIADILLYGIGFDNAQAMVICTRYWLLKVLLCGTMDTLYRRFPVEYAFALLPDPDALHQADMDSAMQLARLVSNLGVDVSPLTLVRSHGPLSASIGTWLRQIRYQASHHPVHGADRIFAAERMKTWLLAHCNAILKRLNISRVDEGAWAEALDCMAGEELADWIPSNVSFGSEDGEMVMRLEYSDRTANGDLRVQGARSVPRVFNVRNPANFGPQHLREWVKGTGGPAIRDAGQHS